VVFNGKGARSGPVVGLSVLICRFCGKNRWYKGLLYMRDSSAFSVAVLGRWWWFEKFFVFFSWMRGGDVDGILAAV
jgi:hypothetical protein